MSETKAIIEQLDCVSFKYTFHGLQSLKLGEYCDSPVLNWRNSLWTLRYCPASKTTYAKLELHHKGVQTICKIHLEMNKDKVEEYVTCKNGYTFHNNCIIFHGGPSFESKYSYENCDSVDVEYTLIVSKQEQPYLNKIDDVTDFADFADFADVHFKVENQSLPAHKLLLVMYSTVFKSMFRSGMIESTSNEIVIDDFDAETVEAFLDCLSKQKNDALSDWSIELCTNVWKMADKYDVKHIKDLCTAKLIGCIAVGTCLSMIQLTNECNCAQVKDKALEFVVKNLKTLLTLQSSEVMRVLDEKLLAEIGEKMK